MVEGREKVLVANDEADILEVIVDRLEYLGFDVRAVGDGQACVEEIERDVPDLVLLDVRMPRMDGLAVLHWMQQHYAEVPVLMVSASADREVVAESLARGVVDYMLKPFNGEELERKVLQALKKEQP